MDGTIYLGKDLFNGALETFKYLNDNNIEYVFFTNNSSHDLEFYHQKMSNFGIKCDLKHNFYSSTEVTISHLLDKGVKQIFVIGNKCLKDKLSPHFEIVKEYNPKTKKFKYVFGKKSKDFFGEEEFRLRGWIISP